MFITIYLVNPPPPPPRHQLITSPSDVNLARSLAQYSFHSNVNIIVCSMVPSLKLKYYLRALGSRTSPSHKPTARTFFCPVQSLCTDKAELPASFKVAGCAVSIIRFQNFREKT